MPKKINHKTLWDEIIKLVSEEKIIQETAIENFLKPLTPIKYTDGILLLETENNFAPQVLNHRYRKKLCETAKKIDGNFVNMKFGVAGEKIEEENNTPAVKTETPPEKITRGAFFSHPVNKQYTFENFVAGYENRLAAGSALGIANSPAKMKQYNPFYIYGSAGVGKTHLLHAIANEAVKKNPKIRVILISGEEFYRNYSAHLKKDTYGDFQNAFEQADIALFDNIHELSGKRESQLELYKIFNKFHQQNKQIVFTANCPPADLSGFQERVITRLQWGLSVKLDVQNIETRTAILSSMANKEKVKISDEEIAYIVENSSENIHDLQGIVVNIAATLALNKSAAAGDALREALKNRRVEPMKGFVSPKTILETVASFYKVDLEEIKGKSRVAATAWARQVAAFFLKKYTPLSLSQIGNELGGKNHSTILHAVKEVENQTKTARIADEIKEISAILAR